MANLRRLPLAVQTTYSDLLARLREDAILELGGTPVLRERSGRNYWYSVQRIANSTVEKYLGPDTDEVRNRVERALGIKEDLRKRQQQRSRLVRMCREGGIPQPDAQTGKILLALSKAGIFRLRGVLVGSNAFQCYPAVLGVDMPEAYARTEDIDLAKFHRISVALDDRLTPDMEEALSHVGPFIARPSLYPKTTAWRDNDSGMAVELLTPNIGPDRDTPMELPSLGAFARPLRFLDYLIYEPTQAVVLYRSGVLVNMPQPARYAIHKLIVATRRGASAADKARKDIEQAAALIRVLAEDRPDELEDAYVEAHGRGSSWRECINKGERRLPDDARQALLDTVDGGNMKRIARGEALSSLPSSVEEFLDILESPHCETDIEQWAVAFDTVAHCGVCGTTVIEPSSFADSVVSHFEVSEADADKIRDRIVSALRKSDLETGGWGKSGLCANHNEQLASKC